MTKGIDFEKLNVIILLNHGIFTWGNDAKTSYERMIEVKSDILIPKPSILNPLTPHVQPKQKCETRSISTVHFLLPQMVNKAENFLKSKNAYFETLESGHHSREK